MSVTIERKKVLTIFMNYSITYIMTIYEYE